MLNFIFRKIEITNIKIAQSVGYFYKEYLVFLKYLFLKFILNFI